MPVISNFIVFEGGDGSGTSTQCKIIRRKFNRLMPQIEEVRDTASVWYLSQNFSSIRTYMSCFTTFEPTDGPIGKMIRQALKKDLHLNPETLAHLFAADRNEHLYQSGGIIERCNRNEIVISDRYIPSSLVYQGIECGEELPAKLNKDFPLPELLFYFDVDPQIALERIGTRDFRDRYEYLDFQIEVHRRYKKVISDYADAGVKVEILDAAKPAEIISQEIWNSVLKLPAMQNFESEDRRVFP